MKVNFFFKSQYLSIVQVAKAYLGRQSASNTT